MLRNLHLRLRLEPAAENPKGTVVVEVPVDAGEGLRTARDLSVWEQLSFAAFLQRYWADNQVGMLQTVWFRVGMPVRARPEVSCAMHILQMLVLHFLLEL